MNTECTSLLFEQKRMNLRRRFSTMIKAVGPLCNLDCDYCYYVDKDALYPDKILNLKSFRMSNSVLETLIRNFIMSQPQPTVEFVWHGGEPTLAGLNFFENVVRIQNKHKGDKQIFNVLQTNGTLIDERWAEFLARNSFFCGLSIDGPKEFHDKHRYDRNGNGSWEKAVRCADLFTRFGIEFNTMSVVNASNGKYPVYVYNFLKGIGSRYMLFTPIVERVAVDGNDKTSVLSCNYVKDSAMKKENISAECWGDFLCEVFDEWVKKDVGSCYVNWFDNTLAAYIGQQPALCSMAKYCTAAPAIEHNGDIYCCDHFVFPEYKLGNIMQYDIADLVKSNKQLFFEEDKLRKLSRTCKSCEYIAICGGDCPKNRIVDTSDNEKISYLCDGFKKFFRHTESRFLFMANELKNGRPPANIMNQDI